MCNDACREQVGEYLREATSPCVDLYVPAFHARQDADRKTTASFGASKIQELVCLSAGTTSCFESKLALFEKYSVYPSVPKLFPSYRGGLFDYQPLFWSFDAKAAVSAEVALCTECASTGLSTVQRIFLTELVGKVFDSQAAWSIERARQLKLVLEKYNELCGASGSAHTVAVDKGLDEIAQSKAAMAMAATAAAAPVPARLSGDGLEQLFTNSEQTSAATASATGGIFHSLLAGILGAAAVLLSLPETLLFL